MAEYLVRIFWVAGAVGLLFLSGLMLRRKLHREFLPLVFAHLAFDDRVGIHRRVVVDDDMAERAGVEHFIRRFKGDLAAGFQPIDPWHFSCDVFD